MGLSDLGLAHGRNARRSELINIDLTTIAKFVPNHDLHGILSSGLQITILPFDETTSYFDANTGWWHLSPKAFTINEGNT